MPLSQSNFSSDASTGLAQSDGHHGNATSVPAVKVNLFHGIHPDGRIRIKKGGAKYLVSGTLSERRAFTDASGRQKWTSHLIASTPGHQAPSANDKSVIACCPTTGKSYRVIGLFKKRNAKPLMASRPVEQPSPAVTSVKPADTEQAQSQPPAKVQACNPRVLRSYQLDFEVIAAQRAAGLDPDLRMSFITDFLQESKANLYRKMGKDFPRPIKRGKGSFWPMSQIEAYKAASHA